MIRNFMSFDMKFIEPRPNSRAGRLHPLSLIRHRPARLRQQPRRPLQRRRQPPPHPGSPLLEFAGKSAGWPAPSDLSMESNGFRSCPTTTLGNGTNWPTLSKIRCVIYTPL